MGDERAFDRGKRPRSVLAGPYGHPFHPVVITVPIGAWVASIVFDVLAMLADVPEGLLLGAQVLIGIGIVGALVAAVLGFLDYSVIPSRTKAKRTASIHMVANSVAILVFAASWIVRATAGHDEVPVWGVVLSVVGLLLTGGAGFLGGELVYRYGVRVADEREQARGQAGTT